MANTARNARIAAAYSEIKKFIDSGSYSKIIKATNRILNDDISEVEAWQCRVAAYIQMEQFKEAASAIEKAPNKLQMMFELAYCKYRLNDVQGASDALNDASEKDSFRVKELKAQILYRLEKYGDCHTLYRELLRISDDGFDMERNTNLSAAQVHRVMQCGVPEEPGRGGSYEQWYNSGCAAAAAGDTKLALKRLNTALQKCEHQLQEESASEEEIFQEQAIIRVQKAYVLQQLGLDKEAAVEYSDVLQRSNCLKDNALLAIIHNNTITPGTNIFETRKKIKGLMTPELEHKLTSSQRNELTLNNCILAYQCQQTLQEDEQLQQDCERLLTATGSSDSIKQRALLILAASLSKANKLSKAIEMLHEHKSDTSALYAGLTPQTLVTLAAAQLRLSKGDVSGGIDELISLPPSDRYRAGVIASLFTLLNSKKQKQQIAELFKGAAAFYQTNKVPHSGESVYQVLRRAADYYLQDGCLESAAVALEQLRIRCPSHAASTLPALITTYAQFDSIKAHQLAKQLPDPADLSSVDVEALESTFGLKYFVKAAMKPEDIAAKQITRVKARKKKNRKKKLPKNYVPGVEPDPERWLPRWQRKNTGGRRRNRDRRKDVGRGTQGGTGDAADKYDITKNPGQYKSYQQQPEQSGPRRNMPKKKASKKK